MFVKKKKVIIEIDWSKLTVKQNKTSSFDADTICDVTTLFRFELACNSHEWQQYLLIVP